MSTTAYPVAIVGAGPVGLTVANLLGTYGVACVLIEQSPGTSTHPRAQTIDDESMRTLQAFGCAARFGELILPAAGSTYYDAQGEAFGQVGAGARNYGFFKRNYMLQQQLEALLVENLARHRAVTQRFGVRLDSFSLKDDRVALKLAGGETLHCRYLLACDGGQSPVRKALGIDMQGWTYDQDWIVLDAVDDPDTERVSRFICDPARPAVSIASPNGGRRYEFMLLPGEDRKDVLSDENLARVLAPFRPWDPTKITRRAVYTFHARIAERLRSGPVFLLGDAAHLTPPFAGQGMNAGIRDAANLAWKLAAVCRHGLPDALLDSYEAERRGPIRAMIQLAVAMGEFVMPVGEAQIALKASLLKSLERFPQARDWLFQMRFKPRPRYAAGVFVALDEQAVEASLVGEMLPQPLVIDASGRLLLLDESMGPGFCLLVQDDAGEAAVSNLDYPIWKVLAPRCLRLGFSARTAPANATLPFARIPAPGEINDAAANLLIARPFRTHRDQVLLVRPDRYVAGACFAQDMAGFSAILAKAFGR